MFSDDESCSECKLELIEKRWTQLMINWINKCVSPRIKIHHLDLRCLNEVVHRYKLDICADELDYAVLANRDIESFIKFKYPILRLRYLAEAKDYPKKMYIMASILLYHCCASSQAGVVDHDICNQLDKDEQELILRFCENLSEMEITINNVDCAIQKACASVSRAAGPNESPKDFATANTKNKSLEEAKATKPTILTVEDSYSSESVQPIKSPTLKFKSSITVMPSVVTDTSSDLRTDSFDSLPYGTSNLEELSEDNNVTIYNVKNVPPSNQEDSNEMTCPKMESIKTIPPCPPGCSCARCSRSGQCAGEPKTSVFHFNTYQQSYYSQNDAQKMNLSWLKYSAVVATVVVVFGVVVFTTVPFNKKKKAPDSVKRLLAVDMGMLNPAANAWQCEKGFCQKVYQPTSSNVYFTSLSRCSLLCMGPQLWPYPIYIYFSNSLVALATNKLEYKIEAVPSENVHRYLAEALKLFIGDLARLERMDQRGPNHTSDLTVKKMNLVINVDSDSDPRMRYLTDESYTIKVDTLLSQVRIQVSAVSFCGVRHGLETLSQLIVLDQSTGYLITLSNILVKDAPSFKYRGLMIDTARNYIPVADLMRTVDAMGTVKLNTFHWRISDATSFPLYLPELRQLFENGAYDKTLMYTKQDIVAIVHRAEIRGIRVLIEVAAPGPVGRAWSWSPDVSCTKKNDNSTCDNILCLRLKMKDAVLDILQTIYAQILELTKVDDIFHLSDGLFSLPNCYFLIDDREGFLEKALERLKTANKGVLPKLPIIWYTNHLLREFEAMTWDKLGVQMHDWQQGPVDQFLNRFRVVHSSRWGLSCQMQKQRCTKYRTWQEMYAWKSFRNIEVFSIEGGEAVLWTDLVDSGNLDYHLWPRLSAVAERLWSDTVANSSANGYTYARLDTHRWRMMIRGVMVQPVWPVYCSFNPMSCINKLKYKYLDYLFEDRNSKRPPL